MNADDDGMPLGGETNLLIGLLQGFFHPGVGDFLAGVFALNKAELTLDKERDYVLMFFKYLLDYAEHKGVRHVADHPEWVVDQLKKLCLAMGLEIPCR